MSKKKKIKESPPENITVHQPTLLGRLKKWVAKEDFNPVIIGSNHLALRFHSFFVTSPLMKHFNHMAMFDDYTEKNLLILIGPLSEIHIEKAKRATSNMNGPYKVMYIEMLFESIDEDSYKEEIQKQLDFTEIDSIILSEFVTLDTIADGIRSMI